MGWASSPASRRRSRDPPCRRWQFAGSPKPATRCGSVCSLAFPGRTDSKDRLASVPRVTFPIIRNAPANSRNAPAHLLRHFVQALDHPDTELRGWQQVVTSLPCCIQFRHSLIQAGANPPYQPGGRHQLVQHFPQQGRCPGLDAASGCQSDFRGKGPRAILASAAAWLTWSNSSWVSENCTVFGRGTACRDRRRTTSSATMITQSLESRPSAIGTAPGPSPARYEPGCLSILMSGLRSVQTYPMDKNILLDRCEFHQMENLHHFAHLKNSHESAA